MHIIITGIHIEMTEAIHSYAMDKMSTLGKMVPKDDSSAKLAIELSKVSNHHAHGEVFQAEAILHIRGKDAALKTTQDDLYKAIDVLKDMLTRELATHKDKERSIVRRGAHKVKQLLKRLG
jgi:ribosomal subunit interface protein